VEDDPELVCARHDQRGDPASHPAIHSSRIHAHITRVKAGHLSIVADPGVIAKVITAAAKATT
jgi:hypothetical protein